MFYVTIHITIYFVVFVDGCFGRANYIKMYAGEWNELPRQTHNLKILGSTPRLCNPLPLWRNIQRKECFIIVLITDKECKFLLSKGWKWRDHIHRTVSGANKKYATENYRLMQDLENFRSQSIKETKRENKRKIKRHKK